MSVQVSGPVGRTGWWGTAAGPYANGRAALVLAAAGAAAVAVSVTTRSSTVHLAMLGALGVGQSVVFSLARSLPTGYRVASSAALLVAFAMAFVPGLLALTPVGWAAAVVLGVTGSLPMWAVAVWRLTGARRDEANSR